MCRQNLVELLNVNFHVNLCSFSLIYMMTDRHIDIANLVCAFLKLLKDTPKDKFAKWYLAQAFLRVEFPPADNHSAIAS
jgi:hypothetical protein